MKETYKPKVAAFVIMIALSLAAFALYPPVTASADGTTEGHSDFEAWVDGNWFAAPEPLGLPTDCCEDGTATLDVDDSEPAAQPVEQPAGDVLMRVPIENIFSDVSVYDLWPIELDDIWPVEPMGDVLPEEPVNDLLSAEPVVNLWPVEPIGDVPPVAPADDAPPVQPVNHAQPVGPVGGASAETVDGVPPTERVHDGVAVRPGDVVLTAQPGDAIQPAPSFSANRPRETASAFPGDGTASITSHSVDDVFSAIIPDGQDLFTPSASRDSLLAALIGVTMMGALGLWLREQKLREGPVPSAIGGPDLNGRGVIGARGAARIRAMDTHSNQPGNVRALKDRWLVALRGLRTASGIDKRLARANLGALLLMGLAVSGLVAFGSPDLPGDASPGPRTEAIWSDTSPAGSSSAGIGQPGDCVQLTQGQFTQHDIDARETLAANRMIGECPTTGTPAPSRAPTASPSSTLTAPDILTPTETGASSAILPPTSTRTPEPIPAPQASDPPREDTATPTPVPTDAPTPTPGPTPTQAPAVLSSDVQTMPPTPTTPRALILEPTPTPTPRRTPAGTPEPTPTTPDSTPVSTSAITSAPTPGLTPMPSPTPTPQPTPPTAELTPRPSDIPPATSSDAPTPTPSSQPTASPTPLPTPELTYTTTPSATPSPTPTTMPSPTPVPTPTPTPEPTPTSTPAFTAAPGATPNPNGYRGPSYKSAVAPTGQKPQSKLWFNDGIWWGSLFSSGAQEYRIHRLNWATQTWTDSGVLIDTRVQASADVLWDGTKLYIVSAGPNGGTAGEEAQLRRFSYDASSDTYMLDSGFPVTIVRGGMEAIVLAKDTTGNLWVTYTRGNAVWVARTAGSDSAWAAPFNLPVADASNLSPDDLSAIVAFDSKIGVMWGNQNTAAYYFATHDDGAADFTWQSGPALAIPEGADDHINLKALSGDPAGRVFAAVKTSLNNSNDPLVVLLVLKPDGTWANHTVTRVADNQTRAIVTIDQQNRQLYVFAASPCCSGGAVYYKQTSLDAMSFPIGSGTSFMQSASDNCINNVTSTKQTLTSTSELVALAGADCTQLYFHNRVDLP